MADGSGQVTRVLVVGCGAMGRKIASTFAGGGMETLVTDRDASRLRDLPTGVRGVAALPDEAPDLVIESVLEDLSVKHALYREMEAKWGGGPAAPILATGTSGLPIEDICAVLADRGRFLAVHYMYPPDAMPMAEVARVPETRDDVVARTLDALHRSGKETILLNAPITGFLMNRLQHAILHEAYHLVETGVVSVADIDRFARNLFGPRMCITGLIEQKDLSGLTVHANAHRSIVPDLYHSAEPSPMLMQLAADGHVGAAAGKGFYDWSGKDVPAYHETRRRRMEQLVAFLKELRQDEPAR